MASGNTGISAEQPEMQQSRVCLWLTSLIPLRFRGQAVLFLFPLIVIISAVYTLEAISTERSILRKEIIKRGETIAAIAAKSAELPLLSENLEQLKSSALTVMEIKDITYVAFLNRRSEVLLQEGESHPDQFVPDSGSEAIQLTEHESLFEFIVPVIIVRAAEELFLLEGNDSVPVRREQIGWVCIGLSKRVMIDSERQVMVRGGVLAVIFSILGVLFLYLFVSLATRPLYTLINAVKEVREGEHPEVPVASPDSEIGKLTSEFNRMSRAIKEREDELRRHRDNLEDLVQERTAELIVAKEQAESASRAKSDFLSSMSHELRTPLNAILGYAQILRLQNNLSSLQRQQVDIMRSSGEHLLMLINDILEVGRIEANRIELDDIPFDLPALMRQVFDLTRLQAEEKDILLSYQELTPLPSYVRGDERKLRQILLNLLNNAVKYTRKGTVTMRVRYDRSADGLFRCEVADTGIGIPSDKLESIFEPFTQLARDRRGSEGTGLGLNITKRLLALMEGSIGVQSVVGEGSVFTMEVPLPLLSTTESDAEQRGEYIVGYRGARKSVLVVDDNVHNTALLVSLLEPLGFDLATAQRGEEALLRMAEQQPDMVLMDLVMPEMDGLKLVQEIRRDPKLASTVIIGTSATITDSTLKNAFLAACDDFVPKPIHIDLLLEKIGSNLGIQWETAPVKIAADEGRGRICEESFGLPTPVELEGLYEIAMMGDMQKVEAWATALKLASPGYGGFADKLLHLAGKFRTREILALVNRCRGDGNGSGYDE